MAAPNPPILKINLIIRQGKQFQLNFNALGWLSTTGRYIIILVELVVIGAFGARFYLDSRLATINHDINERALPYLKQLQKDEQQIRQTQLQLATISQLKNESPQYIEALNSVAATIPTSIVLTNLNFDRTTSFPRVIVALTGNSPSAVEVGAFTKSLQRVEILKDVALTNLVSDKEAGTSFTIVAIMQPKGGR